jgi:hypothetical protein
MKPSLLSDEEQNLVLKWTVEYESFLDFMVHTVLKPLTPTLLDEANYLKYHSWLINHEVSILPFWQLYETWQEMYFNKQLGKDLFYGFDPFDPNSQHPLNYFYEPEDLYRFAARLLPLQEGDEKWEPGRPNLAYALILVGSTLQILRFRQWACEEKMCMRIHWREEVKIGSYRVFASSFEGWCFGAIAFICKIDIEPSQDFGVYLDEWWSDEETSYPKTILDWPDGGVIDIPLLDKTIDSIVTLLESGKNVEIASMEGHGRTGTVLACLLVALEHIEPEIAIKTLRGRYCELAVETPEQENLVAEYYKDNR